MSEEKLCKYTNIVKKIEYLKQKIDNEQNKEIDSIAIKVQGSSKNFPYLQKGYTVEAEEPIAANRSMKKIKKWKKEIEKLEKEKEIIEDYIDNIEEHVTREIFLMKYCEGKTQMDIAETLDISQAKVSRMIKTYLEMNKIA